MPLNGYGVLVGRAVDRRREGGSSTPHYQVQVEAAPGERYRVAVNAKSQQAPSDLLFLVDDDLRHPVTAALGQLAPGWHDLASRPGSGALDFVRGNLFDPTRMRPLPPDVSGPDNDLADLLDHYVQRAIADPGCLLFACGQRWGPERVPDKVFGFSPGNGVHDIHMNQGNSERFRRDDGVWQDGGMLLYLPGEGRWIGVFLAFQSQAWHTDDATGHAIDGGIAPVADPAVRILAALVNP
ncbi:MAG TPA: YukJ family protein, partial [Actinomycetes bacterium]|nr:YukJ family protein [Actinomycetes bacterium]